MAEKEFTRICREILDLKTWLEGLEPLMKKTDSNVKIMEAIKASIDKLVDQFNSDKADVSQKIANFNKLFETLEPLKQALMSIQQDIRAKHNELNPKLDDFAKKYPNIVNFSNEIRLVLPKLDEANKNIPKFNLKIEEFKLVGSEIGRAKQEIENLQQDVFTKHNELNPKLDDFAKKYPNIADFSAQILQSQPKMDMVNKNIPEFMSKFETFAPMYESLVRIKGELESLVKSGLVNDDVINGTQTYSSKKLQELLNNKLDVSAQASDSARLGGLSKDEFILVNMLGKAGGVATLGVDGKVAHDLLPALNKDDIGLGNVDNTSDLSKPVSTATKAALDEKLNKDEQASDSARLGGVDASKYVLKDDDRAVDKGIIESLMFFNLTGGFKTSVKYYFLMKCWDFSVKIPNPFANNLTNSQINSKTVYLTDYEYEGDDFVSDVKMALTPGDDSVYFYKTKTRGFAMFNDGSNKRFEAKDISFTINGNSYGSFAPSYGSEYVVTFYNDLKIYTIDEAKRNLVLAYQIKKSEIDINVNTACIFRDTLYAITPTNNIVKAFKITPSKLEPTTDIHLAFASYPFANLGIKTGISPIYKDYVLKNNILYTKDSIKPLPPESLSCKIGFIPNSKYLYYASHGERDRAKFFMLDVQKGLSPIINPFILNTYAAVAKNTLVYFLGDDSRVIPEKFLLGDMI